jgi:hypothetical protein
MRTALKATALSGAKQRDRAKWKKVIESTGMRAE